MTIKAIFFDAAGTLIHLPRGVGWHYREVAARHGIMVDEQAVAREFGKAFKAAGARVSTPGTAREDDDKGWWRGVVRHAMARCGVAEANWATPAGFERFFEELYGLFAEPGVWGLYPEVTDVLNHLHSRYKLAVLSNFDRRLYPVLDGLRVRHYFETMTISSEVGVDKPDPRIFQAALDSLNVHPPEAVLIGDDPVQDWRGAEDAGMRVIPVTGGVKMADVAWLLEPDAPRL